MPHALAEPEVEQMEITGRDDSPSSRMSPAAWQFAQPWWLHARRTGAASPPPSRDARRAFTAMATQIGLAAWMLGMALTSACVPTDRVGGAVPGAARLDWLSRPQARTQAPASNAPIPDTQITARKDVAAATSANH